MMFINLTLFKKGKVHYYAVSCFDANKKIEEGDQYVAKDNGVWNIRTCTKADLNVVNQSTKGLRRWIYCYKVDQIIETDAHGYAKFYLCIDKTREHIFIYRSDQGTKPSYQPQRERFSSSKVTGPDGKEYVTPRGKCVPYVKLKEFDVDKLSNQELVLIDAIALDWLKLEK